MQLSPQPIKDIFISSGAAKYFAIAAGVHATTSAVDSGLGFLKDSNSLSENTFENAGYGLGGVVGGVGDFAINGVGTLAYFGLRHGGMDAVSHNGTIYTKEILDKLGEAERNAIMKNGTKGVFNSRQTLGGYGMSKLPFMGGKGFKPGFMKNLGMLRGLGFVAAPTLIGMGVSAAAGFAGKMMDQSWKNYRDMRNVKYDQRYFEGQGKYDAQTYSALGNAMQDYSSRMVSLSRIYHSRG